MQASSGSVTSIQIDASAHCQLACPSCPTASGATRPALGAGHLSVDAFQTLLDRNPEIQEVELSNYGEMFLNPHLPDLFRIAFERQVVLHADNGTNLNHASDATLEALVRYRFRSLTVSIDGASPETYARYRVRGDFDRVVGHIRKINEFKRSHSTGFPLLCWQFIVFGHNEHEIAAARRMAAELGMSFRPKISWDDEVSPVRDANLVKIQTGLPPTREAYYQAAGSEYQRGICYQLWNAPVLNWDGRVTGCCRNFWGDFGANAFDDGLAASLDSPKLRHARQMLMGHAEPKPDIPCTTCDLYLSLRRDGKWIDAKELERAAGKPGVLTNIVVDPAGSEATHADLFVHPGHEVNRLLLVQPPPAQRFQIGKSQSVVFVLEPGREYTVYALPKRLDPAFRIHYPAIRPVTQAITIARRPAAQEFHISIGDLRA
jgi:MoaA/NifB/PqqE/SkfB family radical SAM enzyme